MEDVALVCGWPEWGTASLERTTLPVAGHNQLVLSVEALYLLYLEDRDSPHELLLQSMVGVEREGSRAPSEPPHSGNGRPLAREEPRGVREVASQAPCTYTVVRGCARGRFHPLPDTAHG